MEFVAELLVGAYGLPTFNWFSFALKAIVPLQNWCPASKIRMDERVQLGQIPNGFHCPVSDASHKSFYNCSDINAERRLWRRPYLSGLAVSNYQLCDFCGEFCSNFNHKRKPTLFN